MENNKEIRYFSNVVINHTSVSVFPGYHWLLKSWLFHMTINIKKLQYFAIVWLCKKSNHLSCLMEWVCCVMKNIYLWMFKIFVESVKWNLSYCQNEYSSNPFLSNIKQFLLTIMTIIKKMYIYTFFPAKKDWIHDHLTKNCDKCHIFHSSVNVFNISVASWNPHIIQNLVWTLNNEINLPSHL